MSGFPASVFTAIPVDSGFSDYYGSCVALPAGCGFRQSPVAYIKHELSAFSVKGFSHVTFAISLYLEALHPEYHTLVPVHMTSARMTYVSVPFVCRRMISPSSGCQSSSLAFVLIRRFSSPYRPGFRNLLTGLYPPPQRQRHAALPVGFHLSDKSWDDGVFFHLPFFDIFLPAACSRRHLIYTLTGAHTFPTAWHQQRDYLPELCEAGH